MLEQVQRDFVKRIKGLSDLDYWQQLKSLSLYSLQRRRERYLIIYMWKILEGHAPNLDSKHRIHSKTHVRNGRFCEELPMPRTASKRIKSLILASFPFMATKLFNLLPKDLRDLKNVTVDDFKDRLDAYLATIPDQPQIQG